MPEHVVDFLEMVEVEAEHRETLGTGRAHLHQAFEMLRESDTVRQVGERIVVRHVRDLRLGALAVRDILGDAEQILRLAVRPGIVNLVVLSVRVPRSGEVTPCSCSDRRAATFNGIAVTLRKVVGLILAE